MSNSVTKITLKYEGRNELRSIFFKIFGYYIPYKTFDSLEFVKEIEGEEHAQTLYNALLLKLTETEIEKLWNATKADNKLLSKIFTELSKVSITTIYGSTKTEKDKKVTQTNSIVRQPTPPQEFREPVQLDPNSGNGQIVNNAIDSILTWLIENVDSTSPVFTGQYMVRFDPINQAILSIAPQIETLYIQLPDVLPDTHAAQNDDGSVG